MRETVIQSISRWVSQSVGQWVSESVSQWVSQWVCESVSQWVSQWVSQSVSEWVTRSPIELFWTAKNRRFLSEGVPWAYKALFLWQISSKKYFLKWCKFFSLTVLDTMAFERLLGPCMDIMKRNTEEYEEQLVRVFGSKVSVSNSNPLAKMNLSMHCRQSG